MTTSAPPEDTGYRPIPSAERPRTRPGRLNRRVIPGFGLTMGFTLTYLTLLVLIPLSAVFIRAAGLGWEDLWKAISGRQVVAAYKVTFGISFLAALTNAFFGFIVAWVLTRYSFPGRKLVDAIVDLPFALPTAVAGIALTALYGPNDWLGQYFHAMGLKTAYSLTGIYISLTFIGLPFIARELVPVMQAQGRDEEYAALTLGAGGWRTFFFVTPPNIKWGLFYGVVLCNARAMGEFGAVAVVSGNIRGKTSSLPLYIEMLYNEYSGPAAFALASVLALLALVTLVLKNFIEWRVAKSREA